MVICRPIASAGPPRTFHKASLITAGGTRPEAARPTLPPMPSVGKNSGETDTTRTRCEFSPSRTTVTRESSKAASDSKAGAARFIETKSGWEVGPYDAPLNWLVCTQASRDDPAMPGGARNSSASMTLYSVAFAPVPTARLTSSTAVASLLRASPRRVRRISSRTFITARSRVCFRLQPEGWAVVSLWIASRSLPAEAGSHGIRTTRAGACA